MRRRGSEEEGSRMGEEGGLDQFLADLGTTDAKKKLSTGQVRNLRIWGIRGI